MFFLGYFTGVITITFLILCIALAVGSTSDEDRRDEDV